MSIDESIPGSDIVITAIEEELKRSYLDYSMSVIVSRALPDVRDGLKPVHRRILYAMGESGLDYNKPYKKSARIVGEVMAKYHPHGDAAIYDALVRMAQDFSLRVPLIDGQGNFGSMDGDPAAAMRYTETRMQKIAHLMLDDIDKDTVEFQKNYDGSEVEATVLPAKFPNLLVNGAGGIAVGMATNIPTHNLGEVIDACCAYIDNENMQPEDFLDYVQGPDFPTGGIILGTAGIRSAILTGRGSIIMRGRANIETIKNDRQQIIISEMPYQVNKAKMVEKIAELVRDKRIEGISDLRDESDKGGVRVVIEIRKDAFADVVLNQLYSYTPLQTTFSVNCLALDNGRPRLMNIGDVIVAFINFREEVVVRRTKFLLAKSRDKAHILIGLFIAVNSIDEVIALIKSSKDAQEAREKLLAQKWDATDIDYLIDLVGEQKNKIENGTCYLTDAQSRAILDMRLQRLTGLEHEKIANELKELAEEIKNFLFILSSRETLMSIIKDELSSIKNEFATPRKSIIELNEFESDIEDLIPREEMVVTITHGGYIKRVPLSTYRAQRRGGKGRSGITVRDEDITTKILICNTHVPVMFFSNLGKVYKVKVYKLPLATPQSKGKSLMNIFPLAEGEFINEVMALPENEDDWDNLNIFFATKRGNVRKNSIADFKSIQSNGKIAIRLDDNDKLIGVKLCKDEDHIFLAAKNGRCVRFPSTAVRIFKSRTSDGVRGMNLSEDDEVISLSVIKGTHTDIELRENYLKIPVELRKDLAIAEDDASLQEILAQIQTELDSKLVVQMARDEEFILTITANGYGKRTSAYEYRVTNRGGSGVINIITSDRNGSVAASMTISEKDQILLMTGLGTMIRCPVHDVRITSRSTQGVVLFKTAANEFIVSADKIEVEDEEEGEGSEGEEGSN